jgi:hypothetical protein
MSHGLYSYSFTLVPKECIECHSLTLNFIELSETVCKYCNLRKTRNKNIVRKLIRKHINIKRLEKQVLIYSFLSSKLGMDISSGIHRNIYKYF